jgi:hypothetical protein
MMTVIFTNFSEFALVSFLPILPVTLSLCCNFSDLVLTKPNTSSSQNFNLSLCVHFCSLYSCSLVTKILKNIIVSASLV